MITSTVQNSIVKTIDMSLLPPPAFVKTPLFSDVKSNLLSELQILYPQFNALLESDPAVKLLEIVAYREIIITARVNTRVTTSIVIAYSYHGMRGILLAVRTRITISRYRVIQTFCLLRHTAPP